MEKKCGKYEICQFCKEFKTNYELPCKGFKPNFKCKKLSETKKKKQIIWWNNGVSQVQSKIRPSGFIRGKLKKPECIGWSCKVEWEFCPDVVKINGSVLWSDLPWSKDHPLPPPILCPKYKKMIYIK